MPSDDKELRDLSERAKKVSFGSMDGIHDLIIDAECHLRMCEHRPVLGRQECVDSLKEIVEEREKDWPALARQMGIIG